MVNSRNYDLIGFSLGKTSAFLGFVRLPDDRGYRYMNMRRESARQFVSKNPGLAEKHTQTFDTRIRISGGVDMYQPCFMEAWLNFFNQGQNVYPARRAENMTIFNIGGTFQGKPAELGLMYHHHAIEPFASLRTIADDKPFKVSIEVPLDEKNLELFQALEKGFEAELAGKQELTSRKKGTRRALRLNWNKISVVQLSEAQIQQSCCNAAEFEKRTEIFKNQGALLEI